MNEGFTNDSWSDALARYDKLVGAGWQHISDFRNLVSAIGRSPEAAGLIAITSHDTLMLSPYTRYPDWFDGRHIRVHPLPNGHVRVTKYPEFPQRPAETWTVSVAEAQDLILRLIADL